MTVSSAASNEPAPAISNSTGNKDDQRTLPISPYSISLYLRTKDAFADGHNEDLDPTQLPDHHLPSLASNVKRAAWKTAPRDSKQALKQKRDTLIQKVTIGLGHSKEEEGDHDKDQNEGKSQEISPSQMLTKKAQSVLPLLTFRNPWDSYRAPGIWDMLNGGLQWGLPDDYFEGSGKGKYKGGGKHFLKKIQMEMDQAEKDGLRKGWERIEIRKPDWASLEKETNQQDEIHTRENGEEDHRKDFAKATWLGHATTLLQLPSISPQDQPLTESVETKKEAESHQDSETGAKGKKEVTQDQREVEDVRRRSVNILFDPIFSERCSPSQVAGPIRFTPTPCQVEDLPPIDIVLISHNHYDHLDYDTMMKLLERRGAALKVFVPLGNKSWFLNSGFDEDQVIEMDWWDEAVLSIPKTHPSSKPQISKIGSGEMEQGKKIRVICTPAQHGSGRGGGDKMTALWSSWMVEHITPIPESQVKSKGDPSFEPTENAFPEGDRAAIESLEKESPELFQRNNERRFRAFFAGDTGLRYHNTNVKKKEQFPVCPAFEEITKRYGPPGLLFLPISVGSSLSYFRSWDPFPRRFSPFPRVSATLTSSIHMDPEDAVEMAGIMRGKGLNRDEVEREGQTCLAVHYGTFIRNESQTADDLRSLRRACLRSGMHFVRSESGKISTSTSDSSKGESGTRRDSTASWGAESAFGVGTGSKNLEREINNSSPTQAKGWNKTKNENKARVKAMENEKGKKGRFVVSDQGETVWIKM